MIDKESERIEILAGLAREYLHRYGTIQTLVMGNDVTEEVFEVERMICEVTGKSNPMSHGECDSSLEDDYRYPDNVRVFRCKERRYAELEELARGMLSVIESKRRYPMTGCTEICPYWRFGADCQTLKDGCWYKHRMRKLGIEVT